MKVILNHKMRVKTSEDIINNLLMIKSYLEIKSLQKYIELEDIIYQLNHTIKLSHNLYNELTFLYRKLAKKR